MYKKKRTAKRSPIDDPCVLHVQVDWETGRPYPWWTMTAATMPEEAPQTSSTRAYSAFGSSLSSQCPGIRCTTGRYSPCELFVPIISHTSLSMESVRRLGIPLGKCDATPRNFVARLPSLADGVPLDLAAIK